MNDCQEWNIKTHLLKMKGKSKLKSLTESIMEDVLN